MNSVFLSSTPYQPRLVNVVKERPLEDDELGRKRFIRYKAILTAAAFVRYPQNPFVTCLIRFVASYNLFKFLHTVDFCNLCFYFILS